jgi:hypothetical protein
MFLVHFFFLQIRLGCKVFVPYVYVKEDEKQFQILKLMKKKRLNRSTRTQLALKNSRIVQKRARRLKLKNKEIIQELKEVRKKMMNIEKGDILAKIDRLVINMTPAQRLLIEECISFVSAKEKLLDDIRRNGYYFAYLYISKGLQATIFYV